MNTTRRLPLTPSQLAAIERTHRLLDEIARDLRAREKFQHTTAPRKGGR